MILVVRITIPDDDHVPQDAEELENLVHGIRDGCCEGRVDSLYAGSDDPVQDSYDRGYEDGREDGRAEITSGWNL